MAKLKVNSMIGGKYIASVDEVNAVDSKLTTHEADRVAHVTQADRNEWSGKETTSGAQAKVNAHANLTNNPHSVTKAQVGLGSVDNAKQATKVEFDSHNGDSVRHITAGERTAWNSKAEGSHGHVIGDVTGLQSELNAKETPAGATAKVNAHANLTNNPHGVTKSQVGLGSVSNVLQASKTEFDSHAGNTTLHVTAAERSNWNSKETLSGAQAKANAALASANTYTDTEIASKTSVKVDKVTGKGLSTNDYTTAEKSKLAGVEAGANNYSHPSSHPASMITQSATMRFVSDSEKSSWNAKETTAGAQAKANAALTSAKSYTDQEVAALVSSAPEALDTLRELSDALGGDPNFATTIANQIGSKVDKVTGKGLSTNDYTTSEKNKLSGIAAGANNYSHPTGAGNQHIPSGGGSGQALKYSSSGVAKWEKVDWSELTSVPALAAADHNHDSVYQRNIVDVTCDTASATAAKTLSIPGYTLENGDMLAVKFTLGSAVSNPTLNINGTGAINVRLGSTNASTTTMTVGANGVVLMYYDGTYFQMLGSHRTSDSTVDANMYHSSTKKMGATLQRYKFIAEGKDGLYYPLTLENSTAGTKTISQAEFKLGGTILYYNTTTVIAAGGTVSNTYSELNVANMVYTFNQSGGYTLYAPMYLVATLTNNGGFVLDNSSPTSFYTQDLPTTEDGKIYIYLGGIYGTNSIRSMSLRTGSCANTFRNIRTFRTK